MRQMNASPYCAVPVGVNPACWSAATPVAGVPGAHRVWVPCPNAVKSTKTVTPVLPGQAPAVPVCGVVAGRTAVVAVRTAVGAEQSGCGTVADTARGWTSDSG